MGTVERLSPFFYGENMKALAIIFAFAIDFSLVNATMGFNYYKQLNYDTSFYLGYCMIFYGLFCYIVNRDTIGTHLMKYHKLMR
ncbi:hypothetical protein Aeh1hmmORF03c [Aeromonas phage Aeh1]|uniref:Uncharacterized protein n=1 Tax=Aeromonas phage Aeh1 TaxID=2880362 RepID=Q76YH3_9CAUD|nr:hypothetical protein Aeh1p272 [Aeromonas phage Aeh1]AAQ17922.1 hypothetical protein Aeh1hmmORF03c [Aeromonas phage Aeh1]